MRPDLLVAGIVASAAALWLPPAAAGTFTISPLRIELSEGVRTGALTVRNEDSASVVVQAEAMGWAQVGNAEALESTRELLVSPAVFTLPPNGAQLVRVALRRGADPHRELSYRLLLQEVPQAPATDSTVLQIALRLSLPVFVAPAAPAEPALEWSATRDADGRLVVHADNRGEAHARVLSFSVAPADGSGAAIEQPVATYVLPGQSRAWTLEQKNKNSTDPSAGAGTYRLRGTTERGAVAAEFTVGR